MDFSDLPVMQMMTRKMSWLSKRTDLLAENVANVDTPGFRARDLKPVSFRELVDHSRTAAANAPRVTNAAHMTGTVPVQEFADQDKPDKGEVSLNGNDVGLEQQLIRINETQMSYQMTLNLYKKHVDMIRTALGRRR